MEINVTIAEEELKEIVKAHLKEKFKNVNDLKIVVGTKSECVDPYRNEYQTYGVFKGITCKVEA